MLQAIRRNGQGEKAGKRGKEEKGGREQEPNLRDSIREESAAKASGENKGSLRGWWGGEEMKWE